MSKRITVDWSLAWQPRVFGQCDFHPLPSKKDIVFEICTKSLCSVFRPCIWVTWRIVNGKAPPHWPVKKVDVNQCIVCEPFPQEYVQILTNSHLTSESNATPAPLATPTKKTKQEQTNKNTHTKNPSLFFSAICRRCRHLCVKLVGFVYPFSCTFWKWQLLAVLHVSYNTRL